MLTLPRYWVVDGSSYFKTSLARRGADISDHHGFPFGTLVVNVLVSFAIGYILTWSADHTHDHWGCLLRQDSVEALPHFQLYETMAYVPTLMIGSQQATHSL